MNKYYSFIVPHQINRAIISEKVNLSLELFGQTNKMGMRLQLQISNHLYSHSGNTPRDFVSELANMITDSFKQNNVVISQKKKSDAITIVN
jgi:hypothetical protein